MTRHRPPLLAAWLTAALAVLSPVAAQAQDDPPPERPAADAPAPDDEAEAGEPDATRPPRRDPFQAGGAELGASTDLLPVIELRGVILVRGRPPAALLAVGERLRVVRLDTRLEVEADPRRRARRRSGASRAPLPGRLGAPRIALRVTAIDREGVTLEVGEDGPEVVLR